ncbi:MAG TPA: hypothetical protein VIW02_08045, partial [Gammaproteobacteria bacterium]
MSRLFGGGGESRGGIDLCGAEFDRPLRRDGRSWTVIAAHADVRIYNSCSGEVTSGLAAFRDTFYVVAEKDRRLLLAQWNSRERRIEAVVGWAEQGALVLERTARQAEGKLAYRKALIVNKGREGSAGAFREADAYATPQPAQGEESINK